jgi:acetylornithine/N-succinyldiaminopimelate aminotransferase
VKRCFDAGLLLNPARPNVLRFMPSLRVTRAEIDEMTDILSAALN